MQSAVCMQMKNEIKINYHTQTINKLRKDSKAKHKSKKNELIWNEYFDYYIIDRFLFFVFEKKKKLMNPKKMKMEKQRKKN